MAKQELIVDGTTIRINKEGYVSLTDIAKRSIDDTEPIVALRAWLKNSSTLLFLQTWEQKKNKDFKLNRMVQFRMKAADNRNYATPQKYIEETGAIGIISKSGRYGGTFAHSDIALNFCYWLSPEFQVYLMEEFQRLKAVCTALLVWSVLVKNVMNKLLKKCCYIELERVGLVA